MNNLLEYIEKKLDKIDEYLRSNKNLSAYLETAKIRREINKFNKVSNSDETSHFSYKV